MSITWNTDGERKNLQCMIEAVTVLMTNENDEVDDGISLSSSVFSFLSSDDESIGELILSVNEYARAIYTSDNNNNPSIYYGEDIEISNLMDDDNTVLEFRFRRDDLETLSECLWNKVKNNLVGNYEKVCIGNRNYMHFETCLLMLLYRLAFPRRIKPEMEYRFKASPTRISLGIKTILMALYPIANSYLTNASIWIQRMPYYAALINNKTDGVCTNVWGFIDGTLRKTCRPIKHQKIIYSGHKRHHGIKFQSVYCPDGMIACLYGPVPGSRHDSFMLSESGILTQLQNELPDGAWSLYGDPAYPQSRWLFGGYRNPEKGSIQAKYNTEMSRVRECVEWGFKDIIEQFKFLDHKKGMKIFKCPVAAFYVVAAFIQNIRVCFYGNQTVVYFNAQQMTLSEYLNLVTEEED
jgi:nuclease HARBI1